MTVSSKLDLYRRLVLCLVMIGLYQGLTIPVSPIGSSLRFIPFSAEPAMAADLPRHFQTAEIQLTFPESGYAVQALPARPPSGYFDSYSAHLKFCKQPRQPAYVQQVYSDDGWLCHFYELPALKPEQIKPLILKRRTQSVRITYRQKAGIGEETYKGHPLLVWREQAGKTRLDHFLVVGPAHNYLFVSSPYGDGEMIRNVLNTLNFLPE